MFSLTYATVHVQISVAQFQVKINGIVPECRFKNERVPLALLSTKKPHR
jgi:hypothetical protein